MQIETKRLLFRPWREEDAEELFRYASDPDVGVAAGWPPHRSVEESLRVIREVFSNDHTWTLWSDFFIDNPASGRVMEKCGFRDTGEYNWLSHLYRGDERPVKIMRLDYAL